MSGFFQFAHRVWQIASPPTGPPKNPNALKFGILGAAKIAPNALISPASHHPDVIIQAVAARDKTKATTFAKKHGIPQVFDNYDDLLSDPSITCIFIPLPNGLHYEWALKALSLGKHVLLEKPSSSNATEAALLFHHPLLKSSPNPPIILEAFHYRFHPAWHLFTSFLERDTILHAKVNMFIPGVLFQDDDIRFKYDLSGGALMDEAYTSSVLRGIFGTEPEECLACEVQRRPEPNELCDGGFDASFRFPGGGVGEMHGTLVGGLVQMFRDRFSVEVVHRGVVVDDEDLPSDQEKIRTRRVTMMNFLLPVIWHRVDVEDTFVVRKKTESGDGTGDVVRTWKTGESRKAYTFGEAGIEGGDSKAWWTTYRYQLDAFVDRVRGREVPSGAWVDGEDSIMTMRMVDMAYEKSGLPVRPTSKFRLASS